MKKFIPVLCLFFFSNLQAQIISNVNFDTIRSKIEQDKNYYSSLLSRLSRFDTTLTSEECSILYYGQCFQQDYNPYGTDSDNMEKFMKHYKAEEFDKALPLAMKILEKYPLHIQLIFKAVVCNHVLKNETEKAKTLSIYNKLLDVLFESGDGLSQEKAFVVMRVSDEYEMMSAMELSNVSQTLSGDCDVMTLNKNNAGIEKLYFNVSKPLQSMLNMMKKRD